MARHLPPGVNIGLMPSDFEVQVLDDGRALKATITIDGKLYEVGLRPKRTPAEMAKAVKDLTYEVWQVVELFRIGRLDLIAYAAADRHTRGRPFLPIRLGTPAPL